ncbi:hypothetical protein PIB30_017693 [Stylosanthes scabra]|uniref:Disease resistance protein RPS4B/Roq1-like leucine-rich repeats domain-containing protein n=1 Tax=Stylosanthes scabra TaxID=79078 RepID=A0ABU6Q8K7_9FABA|nr:hypothetical protein [Stylosanthes scabra]
MENVKFLDLEDTGIKDLPCSIIKLSGLRVLGMSGGMFMIPNVITMMPQLFYCGIDGGGKRWLEKLLRSEQFLEDCAQSTPSLTWIHCCFENINLLDDFFPLAVAWFPNVSSLDLSGNNFTVLPECILQFHLLTKLIVDDCKHLREIRAIPPKLQCFSAVNCNSLSPWGKSLLLNQELHADAGSGTACVMPGESIPKWFQKRCSGASFSFWFRGTEFSNIALSVAILLKDYISPAIELNFTVAISGKKVDSVWFRMNQFYISSGGFDLLSPYVHNTLTLEDGWNHMEISYKARDNDDMVIPIEFIAKEIGVHYWKKMIGSSINEDIRFTDLYKMTQLIIMMMMLSIVLPNHKSQPLLLETCIGLWTLLFLSHTIFLDK